MRMHWSTARSANSAVTMAPRVLPTGVPQTRVMAASRPSSPRQMPTTSSQRSSFQSGLRAAVSSVKSAMASKSLGSPSSSAGTKDT